MIILRRSLMLSFLFIVTSKCSFRDFSSGANNKTNLVKFVNPLVGTQSGKEVSNGNTYPAVCMPFGMNAFTPQTGDYDSRQIYKFNSKKINGIRVTHQSNPNLGDYGAFSLMPITGNLVIDLDSRASEYSHFDEIATPYYYKINLSKYNIVAEVSPTVRGGMMRFIFPESEVSQIIVDCFPGESYLRIIPQQRRIIGYCKNNSGGTLKNFSCFFAIQFNKPFTYHTTWDNDKLQTQSREATGNHVGGAIRFATVKNEMVTAKISTSFISIKQALYNLNYELEDLDFDQVKIKANQEWNDQLNKIKVDGGSTEDKSKFYTALYRVLQYPRTFYELNEQGKIVHYSPYDGREHSGYMYTDFGFDSGHRGVFPLLALAYPEVASQFMQGLLNTYREGNWLPVYSSPGHRKYGVGTHAAAVIADAHSKDITGFDVGLAYQAMKKDALVTPPKYAPGREGLKEYNDSGYLPYPNFPAAVTKTLDYAYNDYCIYELAKSLNKTDDIGLYESKAKNYTNVFNAPSSFMRGRQPNGQQYEPFNPIEWGGPFEKGNAWHYTFSVPHDIQGLINAMSGPKRMTQKLDSLFNIPPEFKVGSFKEVTPEMTEMVLTDMGQYAHNNPVMHHIPHLYNFVGRPWKTQDKVREIMDKLYTTETDGYCGDDESGQLSAWFVFNALGFYPVCPGKPYYSIGSPLFRKTTINLDNGKTFEILAPANGADSRYIDAASLNGTRFIKNYLLHSEILNGGNITFEMNNKPNRKRGTEPEEAPFSMTPPQE